MKKRDLLFLFILVFLLFSSLYVHAIGVSPARIEVNFEPNKVVDCSYLLWNNQPSPPYYDLSVVVSPVGDLSDLFEIEQKDVVIHSNEWVSYTCSLKLPSELSPGLHENSIIAKESVASIGGGVGSVAGVKMQVWIWVPYPGKFLEGIYSANDVNTGETAYFDVNLKSRGDNDINDIKIYIDIYDPNNVKIDTINSQSFSMKYDEVKDVRLEWNSQGISAGIYKTVARIYYDSSGFLELKDDFRVGDFYIEIINVTVENIKKGSIGKFVINIQSLWNDKINGVYANVKIFKNNVEIYNVNTESVDLPAWNMHALIAYWDSRNAELGDYQAKVIVNYENKTTEKMIDFKIVELGLFNKLKQNVVYIIIIIVLLLLILVNILITLRHKKKDERDKKDEKDKK
ncbi:MAG: hypothetical protein V1663_03860 [archaeon]